MLAAGSCLMRPRTPRQCWAGLSGAPLTWPGPRPSTATARWCATSWRCRRTVGYLCPIFAGYAKGSVPGQAEAKPLWFHTSCSQCKHHNTTVCSLSDEHLLGPLSKVKLFFFLMIQLLCSFRFQAVTLVCRHSYWPVSAPWALPGSWKRIEDQYRSLRVSITFHIWWRNKVPWHKRGIVAWELLNILADVRTAGPPLTCLAC